MRMSLDTNWKITDVSFDGKELNLFIYYSDDALTCSETGEKKIMYDYRRLYRWKHLDFSVQMFPYLPCSPSFSSVEVSASFHNKPGRIKKE